jgi:histidinol-phosphate phosphatase family protein
MEIPIMRDTLAARPAIFLDKDGTLLEDVPFNTDPARMTLAPRAGDALALLSRLGLPLVVVSNQAGIAFGKFAPAALGPVEQRLRRLFAEHRTRLHAFLWCGHHPQGTVAAYTLACACRKPAPGMLLTAASKYRLDLCASWMIGDILDDMEAGHAAGVRAILIDNGNETEWRCTPPREPDVVVANLYEAARVIALDHHPVRSTA